MNIPKVENMNSPKSERPVANQYIIKNDEGEYFQSYRSIVAFIPKGTYTENQTEEKNKIVLDEKYWNYSRTTSKYRNEFLRTTTQETKQKIKEGLYKLADLNKTSI